jgi:hypothetical protein
VCLENVFECANRQTALKSMIFGVLKWYTWITLRSARCPKIIARAGAGAFCVMYAPSTLLECANRQTALNSTTFRDFRLDVQPGAVAKRFLSFWAQNGEVGQSTKMGPSAWPNAPRILHVWSFCRAIVCHNLASKRQTCSIRGPLKQAQTWKDYSGV